MSIETETQATEKEQIALGIKISFRQPTTTISNADLAEYFRLNDIKTHSGKPIDNEWIIDNTGISQRYEEPGHPLVVTPSRSLEAARETLKEKGWAPGEIDFIGVTTSFPVGQNLAAYIKEQLSYQNGAKEQLKSDILEVNAACAGFTVLLHHLWKNEESFLGKKVLLIASEQYSPYLHGFDRMIFSDFTLGMAFEYDKDLRILESQLVYEEDKKGLIQMPIKYHNLSPFPSYEIPLSERFFKMNGPEVLRWASREVPKVIKALLQKSNTSFEEVKLIIPHQANQRITDNIQEKIPIPVYSNIKNRGNTSSASIPLALFDAQQEGAVQKGDKVVFVGFGAGLLICANLIQFSS